MVRGLDHGVPPTLSYISAYTPYTSANSGAILPAVSDFVFNDDRQGYHRHRTSSLSQKMVHQHASRVVCPVIDNQPYTGDIYNQVPTPQKTRVQSAVHSVSDFSHGCRSQSFCIHAPTVPNGATTSYDDHSNFVVLHHFPLSPPPFSGHQQHTILIPSSPLTNNIFPVVCQDVPRTPNHDLEHNSPTGSFSVLEVAPGTIFQQRGLGTANADPVPEHDHDAVVNEPIFDAVLSLREYQWPLAEQMYAAFHTGQYPTNSIYEPTQYDPDSLVITSETATVSPCTRSPGPRPHTNASHRTVSPPSPSSGSLADVFTLGRSRWLQVVESAESESSTEVQNSIDTSPTNSIQQSQSTNVRMGEEPNFCHLCGVSFTQRQVYRRHLKDKHEDKESCPHCSSFKWSRGRPHLYRKHLELKHAQFTSSEDRPTRRTRKHQAIGARECKVPNGRIQFTSGDLVANISQVLFKDDL
ncbi:hypothetical protein EDB92DRAFT_660537 [Lactarius akahatsu]|uniref:C2H2-type domain-containing protein n=1 Tax=Lactarius akahatsu TaxID=416441 RepID=A0AAD4LHB5_9AGAM|nr:hypothetical protein EDB92DRAFT_660537 [Lactarius akahatsu]